MLIQTAQVPQLLGSAKILPKIQPFEQSARTSQTTDRQTTDRQTDGSHQTLRSAAERNVVTFGYK